MATTLLVTNDFPPRLGGIENFALAVCDSLDRDVVVLTRREPRLDTEAFDAALGFPVVRLRGPLLPTPRVARAAVRLLRAAGASRVVFGAAAPLGLLAPGLRRAGARRILALSHGHEVWWARFPLTRPLLRRIASAVDVLSTISRHTAREIGAVLPESASSLMPRLSPPVDAARFAPGTPTAAPVCVAAGRFVVQKGFFELLDAWPLVREQVPEARLLIAGSGPLAPRLQRRATELPGVTICDPVPHASMPEFLRQGRAFALPVRSLLSGWYAEGLGTVFLEAAACGLPVVVGDSGGAPEAVLDGRTGLVVNPEDPQGLAAAIAALLADPARAQEWGAAGREFVLANHSLPAFRKRLRQALELPV